MNIAPFFALLAMLVSTALLAEDKDTTPRLPSVLPGKQAPGVVPVPGKNAVADDRRIKQLDPALVENPANAVTRPGAAPAALAPATRPGLAPGKAPDSTPGRPGSAPVPRPADAGVQLLVPGTATSGKDGMAHDSAKGLDKPVPAPAAPVFGGQGRNTGSHPATLGPKYDSDKGTFRHADGSETRARDPGGNVGKLSDKGDIVYSDGTSVTQDPNTGNRFVNQGSGRRAPGAPDYDAATNEFVYADGMRVRGSDPGGNVGKVNEKGDIVYNDGTMVVRDPATGQTTVVRPGSPGSQPGQPAIWGKGNGSATAGGGSDGRGTTASSGGKDSGNPDKGQGSRDTGGKDDKGNSSDAGDTGGKDSGGQDSGKDDSGSKDTGGKDSGSSDTGSKDTGGKESGAEGGKDAGADKRVVAGQGGTGGGPSSMVQDIIDRRTGKKRDPEPTGPDGADPGCSNDGQPGSVDPAQGGGCRGTGSLPTISTAGQGSNVGFAPPGSVRGIGGGANPDCFNPDGCGGLLPGRTLDPFDRSSTTNPGAPR